MRVRPLVGQLSLLTVLLAVSSIAVVATEAKANPVVLDRVVAVVNDDIILESELYEAIFGDPRFQQALQNAGIEPDPAVVDAKIRELRPTILDDLIHRKLVLAEAERFQIEATEADVDRYLENLIAANGMGTVDELRKAVLQSGQYNSWSQYRARLKEDIVWYQTEQILAQWSVSDAQIREYYRKMSRGEDAKVEVVRFSFRPTDDSAGARDVAYADAKKAARRLSSGEEPSKVGKDLGQDADPRRIARGEVAPKVEDAIFAARDRQVVGPLESGQGYVVYKVLDHLASDVVPYEKAKPKIREQLELEAQAKAAEQLREQLRAKAHVDIRI